MIHKNKQSTCSSLLCVYESLSLEFHIIQFGPIYQFPNSCVFFPINRTSPIDLIATILDLLTHPSNYTYTHTAHNDVKCAFCETLAWLANPDNQSPDTRQSWSPSPYTLYMVGLCISANVGPFVYLYIHIHRKRKTKSFRQAELIACVYVLWCDRRNRNHRILARSSTSIFLIMVATETNSLPGPPPPGHTGVIRGNGLFIR